MMMVFALIALFNDSVGTEHVSHVHTHVDTCTHTGSCVPAHQRLGMCVASVPFSFALFCVYVLFCARYAAAAAARRIRRNVSSRHCRGYVLSVLMAMMSMMMPIYALLYGRSLDHECEAII